MLSSGVFFPHSGHLVCIGVRSRKIDWCHLLKHKMIAVRALHLTPVLAQWKHFLDIEVRIFFYKSGCFYSLENSIDVVNRTLCMVRRFYEWTVFVLSLWVQIFTLIFSWYWNMELELCAIDAGLENVEFFSPEMSKPCKMQKARLRIPKTVSGSILKSTSFINLKGHQTG